MRLKSLEIQLPWPETLLIQDLRSYVVEELGSFGEPVRWAITSISSFSEPECIRQLNIEAVVLII